MAEIVIKIKDDKLECVLDSFATLYPIPQVPVLSEPDENGEQVEVGYEPLYTKQEWLEYNVQQLIARACAECKFHDEMVAINEDPNVDGIFDIEEEE